MITDESKLVKALAYAEYIKDLSVRKENREAEINHLRGEMGLSVGALGDRVVTSPSPDAVPNAVIKLQDLICEYVTDLAEYVDEVRGFIGCLDRIDQRQARALHSRYVRLLMRPHSPLRRYAGGVEEPGHTRRRRLESIRAGNVE